MKAPVKGLEPISSVLDQALVSQQRYMPFGAERLSPDILQTDFGFTGQRNLAVTGLMDYNARWYGTMVGAFTQPDTIVPDFGNPQSLNRYSYVINNPLRLSDPSGHGYCTGPEDGSCQERPDLPCNDCGDSEEELRWCEKYPWKPGCQDRSEQLEDDLGDPPYANCGFYYTSFYFCGPQGAERSFDYGTLNVGFSLPILGLVVSGQVVVALDRYGNVYFGLGPSFGPEAPAGISGSLSGGYIGANSELLGDWLDSAPGEERSEQILSGGFVNGALCFAFCFGASVSLSNPNSNFEVGFGFPQAAVGGGGSVLLFDVNSNKGVPLWYP